MLDVAGEPMGVDEWRVYADSEDDFPNRPEATPVAAASMLGPFYRIAGGGREV